ncbi:hypothetical protein [Nitratiruptor tergarcus]|uniref:Periplasmic protein n=1 Tax=Nitratiruptor tergarcus DSM 16512 TaxID=1069081 RepID=A0A1W1WUI5_9BACT|nr:hypothetical protein [Nitratiruptor tergarcus]SMC09906.1 hypothetical protein SAMN05660197_1728 [Nitratiruptor tergarcus DSM 16512]
MRNLLIFFISITVLWASGRYLSPLPLPKTTFINIDTYKCDSYCLANMLQNEEYFSFLAHANKENIENYKDQYITLTKLFHVQPITTKHFSIRLVCKKHTTPIANKIMKSLLGYFLQTKQHFNIDLLTMDNNSSFANIPEDKDTITIVLATFDEKEEVSQIDSNSPLFIPTINKKYINTSKNFYFGGIDYTEQLEKLLHNNQEKLAIFYLERSPLSQLLTTLATEQSMQSTELYAVDNSYANLKNILKDNEELNSSAVLFNTPLITTSLTLSQMRLYDIVPAKKLSTQINFSPKLFKLTQPKDRSNLFIAAISSSIPKDIDALNALFEQDLFYEWLNYVTLCGIDAFLAEHGEKTRVCKENFLDNQLQLHTTIFVTQPFSFEEKQIPPENMAEF